MNPPAGAFRILYRHFLAQFFENELVAPAGELRSGLTGILAFIAAPSILLPIFLFEKYSSLILFLRARLITDRDPLTWSDKSVFLALAIVIPALALLLKWDALFPTRADHAILVPFPIPLRTIFFAKAAALGTFVLFFATAANAASALLYPAVVLGNTGTFLELIRFVLSHFLSTMAASLCACFFLISVQGVGLSLLGLERFRRISAALQFLILTALLTLLILSPALASVIAKLRQSPVALWIPSWWFVGLYQVLLGKNDPAFQALARIAQQALAACSLTALAAYTISYSRHFRRIQEILERGSSFAVPIWLAFDRLAARFHQQPAPRALFAFVVKVFARSRAHRLLFGVFLSLALAMLLTDALSLYFFDTRNTAHYLLAAPLIVCFFLLTGIRFIYDIPAELPANWVFRLNWQGRPATFHRLPVAVLAAVIIPTNFLLLSPVAAALHTLYCLLLSGILVEALFLGYRKIPFTCAFGAAKWNVTFAIAIWFFVFATFTWVTVRLESFLFANPALFSAVCLLLAGGIIWLIRHQIELWLENPVLQFFDGQAPAVQTLDLE